MDTVLALLQSLPEMLGPVLATAFGLITLDLGLGVAVALRTKNFNWRRVTEFYKTNVFPFAIVAVVVAAGSQFISAEVMPADLVDEVSNLGTLLGVGPMFAHLILGSLLPNARALALGKTKWQVFNPEWNEPSVSEFTGLPEAGTPITSTTSAIDVADDELSVAVNDAEALAYDPELEEPGPPTVGPAGHADY